MERVLQAIRLLAKSIWRETKYAVLQAIRLLGKRVWRGGQPPAKWVQAKTDE